MISFLSIHRLRGENGTYKLPLQLALGAAAWLALERSSTAVVGAHIQVIVGRDALAQVCRSCPEVGEGRLGARAVFGTAASLEFIFALHVIFQTPQVSCIGWKTGTNDAIQPNLALKMQQRFKVKCAYFRRWNMYKYGIFQTITHCGGNKFPLSVPGLSACLSIQNGTTEMYDCCHDISALTADVCFFVFYIWHYPLHLGHERGHQQNTYGSNSDVEKLMHAE